MKCKYCGKPILQSQDAAGDAHIDCIQDTVRSPDDAYYRDAPLDTTTAANLAHCSRRGILAAIGRGKLKATRFGKSWLIRDEDLRAWLASPRKVGKPKRS